MNPEEVFETADSVCFHQTGKHLNTTQKAILIGSVEQLTYDAIGQRYGYSGKYLRQDAGPELWNLLSQALGEEVGKKSFLPALQRWRSHQSISPPGLPSVLEVEFSEPDLFLQTLPSQEDWGTAPDIFPFYGRTGELEQLEQKIRLDGCRVVALFGMAGIGKTALSIKLAQSVRDQFDTLIWRSLHPALPLPLLLTDLMGELSRSSAGETNLSTFIRYLQNHRCLILLDGLEVVLRKGVHDGSYQEGYDAYSHFLHQVGRTIHQSCLIVTSREKPKEVAMMEGETRPICSLELEALDESVGRQILEGKGQFLGSASDWRALIRRYQGNPLALHLVATTIQEVFSGNIAEFLAALECNTAMLTDIRTLFDQQFERLSDLEKTVLHWLTRANGPVTFQELCRGVGTQLSMGQLQEVVQSLRRRSLIDVRSSRYSLPTLVTDYVTHGLK